MEHIIQVSSREFRDKQKAYFELADKGEQIVIRRKGKKCAYILTPVNDDDLVLSPEMQKKIENPISTLLTKLSLSKSWSIEKFSGICFNISITCVFVSIIQSIL